MVILMDETIGVKGGRQDRKRKLVISKNRKKKLEKEAEEIKELEKKVKKQQVYTFIRALPIAIGGEIIKTIYENTVGKKKKEKEEENSKWKIKEYDADMSPKTPQESRLEELKKQKKKTVVTPTGEVITIFIKSPEEKKYIEEKQYKDINSSPESKNKEEQEPPKKFLFSGINEEDTKEENDEISNNYQEKIGKIKSKKIVEEYERKLKEIRYDLRQTIYEYNVLVDQEEAIVVKKDVEIILEELSDLIEKVENLKLRLEVENLDEYDENYIMYLIEGYFEDFKNKKDISEIKESPIYIMISEKLEELDKKKDNLKGRLEEKKEELREKDEAFEDLKNKYYSINQLNEELIEFQRKQERIQKQIEEKVANATTITEKVEYQFRGINEQTKELLKLMSFQMFLPGPRFAKGLIASAAAHMFFINNILNPNMESKTYKVITVKDYSDEIKNSINQIDNTISSLGNTSSQIDRIISQLKNEYADYFGVVKECDEMLSNLQKIKRDLKEKEFEMQKIKEKQQKELEKNNTKILTRGKYPVN